MVMAWEKRSIERQGFLRELMSGARREEDSRGSYFFFQLARVIHDYLEPRDPYLERSLPAASEPSADESGTSRYFHGVLLPQLRNFARTESELNTLLAWFLENLTSDIVGRFDGELRRDELAESEEMKIFGAHRTAEVELEFTEHE